MSEQAKPANVVAAVAAVMAEIGGIDKKTAAERAREKGQPPSEQGVSYAYRGIDQIAAAAQPLFGRYGVIMVPTILSCDVAEITVNNKPWTDTTVVVNWSIYGPGGTDDMIEARTNGQGRDNGDKGINKAMTGAFKNLLLRLLCIGDQKDDTDGTTHERDNVETAPTFSAAASALFDRLKAMAPDAAWVAKAKALSAEHRKALSVAALDGDAEWLAVVQAAADAHTPDPEWTADDPNDPTKIQPYDNGELHGARRNQPAETVAS